MTAFASGPQREGLIPLTVFDKVFERTTFVTGWLVEGTIDADALESALRRVIEKWRFLAGRVISRTEGNETRWFVSVPLGPIPADYPTYSLTSCTSERPLSDYVSLPIPLSSVSLPTSVFVHPSVPRQYTAWEQTSHPLTSWHLTDFPASANGGQSYTAIGFARSHGVFDGMGAVMVTGALVAELQGKPWTVPPPPTEGVNVNPFVSYLERELQRKQKNGTVELACKEEFKSYSLLGLSGFLKLVAYHVWETWWNGAERKVLILPRNILAHLVSSVKAALVKNNKSASHITSGDVIVAWLFKTIYSSNVVAPQTIVHVTNVAAVRRLLVTEPHTEGIATYAGNAFIPIPYPVFTASDVRTLALCELTSLFAASRLSLSKEHVVAAYARLKAPTIIFPTHEDAEDDLMISNVSASRILETDWTLVGATRTICGYRYQLTPTKVIFTNAVFIAGRLADGSVVLDVCLNRVRYGLLMSEIQRLSDAAAAAAAAASSESDPPC